MPGFVELLAPAGSMDAFRAAVEAGADAVYFGGKKFSARQYADNFSDEEIAEAVKYARIRGVKTYVTVNTLLDNEEILLAVEFLFSLYRIGVDGAIIQDLGLLKVARQVLPEFELHASTQMTVHNSEGACFLQQQGLARVVLAREVSLADIQKIHQVCPVDLEVFVHGALCISYSGQCLMSSLIGGRSGNRGRCAQPCRLEYTLVNEQGEEVLDQEKVGRHLLSPKDLKMVENLPDLVDSGVVSFKIEGRMKRPEYVATVVRVYRQALDQYRSGGDYRLLPEWERSLAQIFNRGFTTGYYYGRPGKDLMSYARPNNRGIKLGKIMSYHGAKKQVEIKLDEVLRVGDGIEVWVSRGGRIGVVVSTIELNGERVSIAPPGSKVIIPLPERANPGDRVFKTHDEELIRTAREFFASSRLKRKIPLNFKITGQVGRPLILEGKDLEGYCAVSTSDSPAEQAVKRPLTREVLWEQLDRLGNTPFELASLEVDLAGEVIIPLRELNEMRRRVVDSLEEQRAKLPPLVPVSEFKKRLNSLTKEEELQRSKEKPLLSVVVGDLSSLKAAVNAGADQVYFGGENLACSGFTPGELKAGIDFCRSKQSKGIIIVPRIVHESELPRLYQYLEQVVKLQPDGLMVSNIGGLAATRKTGQQPVYADFPLNIYNDYTARFLQDHGVVQVTLSPELNLEQISRMEAPKFIPAECVVHGGLLMMISEYCALGALLGGGRPETCRKTCFSDKYYLKDRMNFLFPIACDDRCRMYIYNPKELCMIEHLPELLALGLRSVRIEAKKEGQGYVRQVVAAYRNGIDIVWHDGDKEQLLKMKKQLENITKAGFTKGHYFRGVL